MNIKKRSIVAFLIIIAMTFSLLAFTSCGGNKETEETITVHVTITGLNNEVLSDRDLQLTGYPSDLTAEYATKQACSIEGIDYNYDSGAGVVTQIGKYINEDKNATTAANGTTDPAATTAAGTTVATTGLFWYLKINDVESSSSQKLNASDKIVWSYVDLAITDQ